MPGARLPAPVRGIRWPAGGGGVKLDAWAENGIVAADDGQPWPGCTNLPLPFP